MARKSTKTAAAQSTQAQPAKRTRRTKREMIRDGFAAFGLFPEID
jgi:hypothetical protein